MTHCEFCLKESADIQTQDMGEGRTMQLCTACRQNIADGIAKERHRMTLLREEDEGRAHDLLTDGSDE